MARTFNRQPIDRQSHEYIKGITAFNAGFEIDDCPYPVGSLSTNVQEARIDWMVGWLTQRSRVKHRALWQKYGIAF